MGSSGPEGGGMYSSSYSPYSMGSPVPTRAYTSPSYGANQSSRYREMVSTMYSGLPCPSPSPYSAKYTLQYSSPSYTNCTPPPRGYSLPPIPDRATRQRTVLRLSERDEERRNIRLKSPSIPRERTRDELIDSIVHTRTREHRAMPGFKSATDYDERRTMRVDCDKVFNGIIIGNGDTICNINYLKSIGVTHVLNTAEHHVEVNPAKYACYGIQYYGFHVDDLPESNISRYFHSTTSFIDRCASSGGLVVVNCVMGWSRSATCVAAYLMMKHKMKATKALELIRQNRSIRPNAGFLQQLADLENTLSKRISW